MYMHDWLLEQVKKNEKEIKKTAYYSLESLEQCKCETRITMSRTDDTDRCRSERKKDVICASAYACVFGSSCLSRTTLMDNAFANTPARLYVHQREILSFLSADNPRRRFEWLETLSTRRHLINANKSLRCFYSFKRIKITVLWLINWLNKLILLNSNELLRIDQLKLMSVYLLIKNLIFLNTYFHYILRWDIAKNDICVFFNH